MRKLVTAVFPQSVFMFCLIISFIVVSDIQTSIGAEPLTVEGVWQVISVSSPIDNESVGVKTSISRKGDIYEVIKRFPNGNPTIYNGNERRIVNTNMELIIDDDALHEGTPKPPSVKRMFAGQRVPINYSYTLSADGNFLTYEQDSIICKWETNTTTGEVRNVRYEIKPSAYKFILKRISGLAKAEDRGDRAYQANCGKVDPNRTTPFPPDQDFCPGNNLLCMTNFCGGGTGCPYVCCPKGLPYLNHCDCKCYATPDFDCHSYSYCKEQPRQ